MSFALNGTHIEGGTFNNVAGNMTQVFNSRIRPIRVIQPSDRGDPDRTRSDDSRNSLGSRAIGYRGDDSQPTRMHLHDGDESHPADISTTYTSVAGNMTQFNLKSYGESGIDILYRSVVIEALHDSGERFPEPACHPGTRTRVLEMLTAWSVDTSRESPILWLYGAAGMGKSAIAQMFAGNCAAQGLLGASFFFRRGHPKRGTWDGLFTTLAYQLATSVSELLFPIQQVVEADKLIVGRAMTAQFQKLLSHPFQNTSSLQFIPVIVLDGLDECKDHKVQQQILHLFITAIRDGLQVRLLITSRPEPHLLETLQSGAISAICRHSELRADDSAYADIKMYLCDEFARIYHEFLARGIDLGHMWPAHEAVMHLVKKSSGIFIYAATVIRFVGDEYTHPAERLTAVLCLDPRSTAPLDDLYTEILSVVPPEATRLRVLHAIWQGTHDGRFTMRPEHIETLFQLPPGSARLALRAFHSLFYLPPMYTRFSLPDDVLPLHASLGDYLGDPGRSGRWCVSVSWLHEDFLHCVLRLLSTPRNTVDTRNFHTNIVGGLPMLLSRVIPTDALISLLRNKQVQNTIFFHFEREDSESWPKRDSGYPRDLIRLWEDHRFITKLVDCSPTNDPASPTYKFDALYRKILGQNADLLFLLRSKINKPYELTEVVFFLGPQYNPGALRPLLKLREVMRLPLRHGDSPIDFLKEPHRAGDLYLPQKKIAEDLVLLWILNTRTRLKEKTWISRTSPPTFYWLDLLRECPPSQKIAHELKSLDLAQICHPKNISPADHHYQVHAQMFSDPRPEQAVLDWLQVNSASVYLPNYVPVQITWFS
ncbi:hypothetical protein C8F04DRAFT_1134592 [Mycena alexandri]|uniref:Nephrocystin 3-like N-terminal domain-containing protein n=1 Tax=Mycena alexandri TaxID=1745969 RepID=A0AAD6S9H2_9AGAR|nr:hypothetical protein C8F04DRAFT_1134592 [Mycena alexandri]